MKEGVPYLSQVEEDTVRARAEAHTTGNDPNWEYIDPEVKAWCEAQVEKILEWKDSKARRPPHTKFFQLTRHTEPFIFTRNRPRREFCCVGRRSDAYLVPTLSSAQDRC